MDMPNVRPIKSNDEKLFYDYLKKSKVGKLSFENNWPYIIQSTRDTGFVYEKDGSILYFRPKDNQLVVVNRLGKDRQQILSNFIADTKEKCSILVKNVDLKELEDLKAVGFIETTEPWSKFSFRDDNTFPEYVSDFDSILNLKPDSVRHSTIRVIRKFKKEQGIVSSDYSKDHENEDRKLLRDYADHLNKKGAENSKEVIDAHNFFFSEEIENKQRFSHFNDGKLIAVSFYTPMDIVTFANAIINKNQSNLMRYLLWEGLRCLKEKLIHTRLLSLQGSENVGQDFLKRSFKRVDTIKKTHVVYQI